MRLKTNITVITDALEKIKSLRGVYYNWSQSFSSDRRTKIGFLAQEVKQVSNKIFLSFLIFSFSI